MFSMAKIIADARQPVELPPPPQAPIVVENPAADRWVVMGGSSQMGGLLNLNLAEQGARVIATSRRDLSENTRPIPNVTWAKTANTYSEEEWETVFRKEFQALGPDKKLNVANMVNNMENFTDNVKVTDAAVKGLVKAAKKEGREYHFVHVSTIAAGENANGEPRIPNDAYASSKTKSEEIVQMNLEKQHFTLYRMAYGLDNPTQLGRILQIDNTHAYAPDQMATLFWQPIVGDGKQIVQPVALQDAIDGIINAPKHPEISCIDAVGPEAMTQEEFYKFFRELQNKPFRPVYLPPEQMTILAELFPYGHFAPFATKYLEKGGYKLDPTPLETVLGRPAAKLAEIYPRNDGDTYVLSRPPVRQHLCKVAQTCIKNPKACIDAAKTMPKIASYAYNNHNKNQNNKGDL